MVSTRWNRAFLSGSALLFAVVLALGVMPNASAEPAGAGRTSAAEADALPQPPPVLQRDENVVTADPLPTVQIDNGYVWAQATIGSTVYAVGDFDNARDPMAEPGTHLTPRSNVLAFDLKTGNLLPFAPQVNGVVKAVAPSADGSLIYIGGSFTSVNGQTRYSLAALNAKTGELVSTFKPAVGGTGVYALAVHGSTVYAGGLFTQGNGVARQNLAAFSTSNGALQPWAPQTDRQVDALVVDPGGKHIIVGGRFTTTNGSTGGRGVVATDPATGALDTDWELPKTVQNGSDTGKGGIFSLTADDKAVYGTGWVYGGLAVGNLEGTFAAEAGSGKVRWIADCLGDHYGVYSTGKTVYTTSHTHACDTMGLHSQSSPAQYKYAEAYTTEVGGLLGRQPQAGTQYKNWEGTPGPSAYAWFPDFSVGRTSGLQQAGLSITGAGDTIAIAGEFPSVNNRRFEGIVRFSTNPAGGAKEGPRMKGSAWQAAAQSVVPGRTRVTVPANVDRDDTSLTYELHRSGTSAPVATKTQKSLWFSRPGVTLEDPTAEPGKSYTYTVVAKDADGNSATSASSTVTVATGTASAYTNAVLDDHPVLYYPLGDTPKDWAGANAPVSGIGVTPRDPGIGNSSTGRSDLNGTSSGRVSSSAKAPMSPEFSTELWFRTTTTRGGKLIGYGDTSTGNSGNNDRHVYMRDDGRLVFGVYPGVVKTVQSESAYNDGAWHHLVASLSTDGMAMYVDGTLVDSDATTTTAQSYAGYWRIGGDTLSGWTGQPSSNDFDGAVDEAAVYDHALSSSSIRDHFGIGHGLESPTASFTTSASELTVDLDASGSTAAGNATIAEYRWDFGDGSAPATGKTVSHEYTAGGSYDVTLTVRDSNGLSSTQSKTLDLRGPNTAPTAAFTSSVAGRSATLDASTSADADGKISTYDWNFGDGSAGTGKLASHQYASDGTFDVTLTVTDDRGATHSVTHPVSVTADALSASDTFGRTESTGWGTADLGGAWSASGGSATAASVADGAGTLNLAAGSGRNLVLGATPLAESASAMTYTLKGSPSHGALYVGLESRFDSGSGYRAVIWHRDNGSAWLLIQRQGVVISSQPVSGLTWAQGDSFHLKSEVTGTDATTIRAKVWADGSAEPSGWQVEKTEAAGTALIGAGPSGVYAYRAGSGSGQAPVAIDDYRLKNLGATVAPPEDSDPVADFSSSTSGRTVSVDASASADADGDITEYAWDFGDGSTGTGVTTSHQYSGDGDYEVTLTVTDESDATSSVTHSVSVSASADAPAVSDTFGRTLVSGWGTADVGGDWTGTGGTATAASVADGTGVLNLPAGGGRSMVAKDASLTDSSGAMTYSLGGAPSTGALYVGLESRFDNASVYRATVWHRDNGSMWLLIQRKGAVIASQPLSGMTWALGDSFHLKSEVTGTDATTIRAKVWADGSAEPSGWQVEKTEATGTALTGAGSPGAYVYRSGSANGQAPVKIDDLRVADLAADPAPARKAAATPAAEGETGAQQHEKAAEGTAKKAPATKTSAKKDAAVTREKPVGAASSEEPSDRTQTEPDEKNDDEPAEKSADEPPEKKVEKTDQTDGDDAAPAPVADDFDRDLAIGWGEPADGGAWVFADGGATSASVADGSGRMTVDPGASGAAVLDGLPVSDGVVAMTFRLDGVEKTGESAIGVIVRDGGTGQDVVQVVRSQDGTARLEVRHGDKVLSAVELTGVTIEAGTSYTLRVSTDGSTLTAELAESEGKRPAEAQLTFTDDSSVLADHSAVGVSAAHDADATSPLVVTVENFAVTPQG